MYQRFNPQRTTLCATLRCSALRLVSGMWSKTTESFDASVSYIPLALACVAAVAAVRDCHSLQCCVTKKLLK